MVNKLFFDQISKVHLMYKKILDLLSEHSVALAILTANIVAAIIISRAASKDKVLQNKYQLKS
jgi:hypothetical protein